MACNSHFPYATLAAAEEALRQLVEDLKRTNKGGRSWKRLNVWKCGTHFHVGRANKLPKCYQKPAKALSAGDLRRKERHADKELQRSTGRKARHVLNEIGYGISDIEEAARRAKTAIDELNDSLAIARQLAARYVFVGNP